jgi:hypothetical protein
MILPFMFFNSWCLCSKLNYASQRNQISTQHFTILLQELAWGYAREYLTRYALWRLWYAKLDFHGVFPWKRRYRRSVRYDEYGARLTNEKARRHSQPMWNMAKAISKAWNDGNPCFARSPSPASPVSPSLLFSFWNTPLIKLVHIRLVPLYRRLILVARNL